jgi:hypothetical protein
MHRRQHVLEQSAGNKPVPTARSITRVKFVAPDDASTARNTTQLPESERKTPVKQGTQEGTERDNYRSPPKDGDSPRYDDSHWRNIAHQLTDQLESAYESGKLTYESIAFKLPVEYAREIDQCLQCRGWTCSDPNPTKKYWDYYATAVNWPSIIKRQCICGKPQICHGLRSSYSFVEAARSERDDEDDEVMEPVTFISPQPSPAKAEDAVAQENPTEPDSTEVITLPADHWTIVKAITTRLRGDAILLDAILGPGLQFQNQIAYIVTNVLNLIGNYPG